MVNDNTGNLKRITLYSARSIVLLCAGCAFEISSSELGAMIMNALNPDSAVNTGILSGIIIVIAILLFYFIANSLKKPISSYDNDLPKFLGVVYGFIVSFADNFTGERIKDSLFDGLGAAGMPDYAIVILLIAVGAILFTIDVKVLDTAYEKLRMSDACELRTTTVNREVYIRSWKESRRRVIATAVAVITVIVVLTVVNLTVIAAG